MRKALTSTAAIVAAVVLLLLITRPPAPAINAAVAPDDIGQRTVAGAYHVHTSTSDGTGGRQEIARAAAQAGLRFVIFTDHGDGTRPPNPPEDIDSVLCLDGVEISSNGGHYVALDMRTSPFPLGGEASAVVEDVRRLGGFGIAAHPASSKDGLTWTDWSSTFDGLEWLNADSEWRDEPRRQLARAAIYYPFRPAGVLASVLDRPVALLSRWDSFASVRPVVGLAAHDAHGGLMSRDDASQRPWVGSVPSYRASFRTFAVRAVLASPLTGVAAADGRAVLDAIRRGRVFTSIDAVAGPAWLDFRADRGDTQATMGDALVYEPDVRLSVRTGLPPGGQLVMICGGKAVANSPTGELSVHISEPGACRPEVLVPGAPGDPPGPWNSLATRLTSSRPSPNRSAQSHWWKPRLRSTTWTGWSRRNRRRRRPSSRRAVDSSRSISSEAVFRRVSTSRPSPDFGHPCRHSSACCSRSPPTPPCAFQCRCGSPGRALGPLGLRRARPPPREPSAHRLRPRRWCAGRSPDFQQASSLLFVIDLTNANPGTAGKIQISDIALGRPLPLGR